MRAERFLAARSAPALLYKTNKTKENVFLFRLVSTDAPTSSTDSRYSDIPPTSDPNTSFEWNRVTGILERVGISNRVSRISKASLPQKGADVFLITIDEDGQLILVQFI